MTAPAGHAPDPADADLADWPSDLLCVADLPCLTLAALLARAQEMKRDPARWRGAFAAETLVCFFDPRAPAESAWTATAAHRLGMLPVVLPRDELEGGEGHPIEDAARAFSTTAAALFAQSLAHRVLRRVAAAATVPVINGRCDEHSPCQALADLLTLREHLGRLAGAALAFVGDGRDATVHSLMEAGALSEMDVRIACPPECRPSRTIAIGAETFAAMHGGRLTVTSDVEAAVAGADAVYTKAWALPREEERADDVARLRPYRVDPTLMKLAKPGALFMHSLPARRGEEVATPVIDGRRSVVWEQAANRVPAQQAAIYSLVTARRAREAA